MHTIKNISEKNNIDTQTRADTYTVLGERG